MASEVDQSAKKDAVDALCASRREEILTQAATLFAKHGYSETDTQLLAETIGIGKGTVYRYFSSKRELFLAAVDRVMRMMRQRVDASLQDVDDPIARIATGIRVFLEFFADHPEFTELLIQERALFKDRSRPTFIEHRIVNIERWRALYRKLIGEDRVRDLPVERITDVMGNVLYGTIFMNYFSGQTKSPQTQAKDIMDIMFNGLLTPSERSRGSAASFDVSHLPSDAAAQPVPSNT
jgi:AcrR family transcriptional regulator